MTPPSKRLWAPWRVGYIVASARSSRRKGCLFCLKGNGRSDRHRRIVTRGRWGYSLLNRFPYNNGHLLIVPYRHVGRLEALRPQEWMELWKLVLDAKARLHRAMKPHGYNIGINLGRAAGAGIPGHLHLHLVPRWQGDTNFMPALADIKVISQSLAAAHRALKNSRSRR